MNLLLAELKNKFLATGVGSLPHLDARDAIDFVFRVLSHHLPFWPQLPRRSFYENMYVQFSEKLPGLCIDESAKTIGINTQSRTYLAEMEACFHKIEAKEADYFAISRSYAEGLYLLTERLKDNSFGFVKAQLIGPLSLGLSLLDENKNPILYNPEFEELLPAFLSLKAAWIIKKIKEANAGTKIIIFIDEPYLVAVGTSQCSLPREAIQAKINQLVSLIHDNGALAGLHCCGNTDWELVMATDIDILNFDAYGYLDKIFLYETALAAFLKKGRIPAIGIVPNNEDLLEAGLEDQLLDMLQQHASFLKNGALITTSCGCSGLSKELTKKAHKLSVGLAERLTLIRNKK
jgi:hypothetical protein